MSQLIQDVAGQSEMAPGELDSKIENPKTTVNCYEFWDRVFCRAGLVDYTEGYYNGDRTLPYDEAQLRQLDYLLDEARCESGSRILDIGCGNGSLLARIRSRGATGVGVTISPQQVEFCHQRGLDARLLNYRDLGIDWYGKFDAVIANGSIEHFVQPEDAVIGQADSIYRQFFAICHHALDPDSGTRRFVNTTIHLDRFQPRECDLGRSPWSFPWFSDRFHYAMLVRGFGGHYPSIGQLSRCARGSFRLVAERDATLDYHFTSEAWLRHGRRSLFNPKQLGRLVPFALQHPRHAGKMMFLLLVSQSWNWQFRTNQPPMKHLWQTWEAV